MVDEMANHATRIQRYVDRYGTDKVESFIDCCLSLENLIDSHWPYIKRKNPLKGDQTDPDESRAARRGKGSCHDGKDGAPTAECSGSSCASCGADKAGEYFSDDEDEQVQPRRLRSKGYMDNYINPPDFLESRAQEMKAKRQESKGFPESPEADVLLFLTEHAPLKNWQRDILSIIREEAYYYLPQGQTKIMNEGWATYWHSRIMTEKVLKDGEVVDYAEHHAGTVGGSKFHLNPYKLGLELFRDIEERWNKGRFGKEYEDCDDLSVRDQWDLNLGLGLEKIFEVRQLYNDLTFIDTFLTDDFCRRQKLFVYAKEEKNPAWVIKTREFNKIKDMVLNQLTNLGNPLIRVLDGNFENRGELLMIHHHEGKDLKWNFAHETLVNLQRLWKRPVHLETKREDRTVRLSFDGKEHQITEHE
jgi:stage V sporulation protein R